MKTLLTTLAILLAISAVVLLFAWGINQILNYFSDRTSQHLRDMLNNEDL